ncbi:hypothetical protein P175DRAFT_0510055 [Aspergillus ochraceoroseus IBT 24754]|uniref:Protein kinase domain-containing protein n=1 Tax=Aspergillus ochraceoroseus IBT 24754 TaxID=1392256 RepID=A0A2T5LV02_9EURO|nr:uncharacterized protein P175DRAFT_0510055 [Aspergillus ochraceoroseus IBT 24754]PTU20112.1 hypothetical protein P175DRAFT_0510055 [Aspergillus ochraceoroseus IBT 24754]
MAPSHRSPPPANNGTWYRYSTLLAVKVLKHVRPCHGNYGRRVHLSEASTMHFISRHTSIPVPKVFCAFTHSGLTYIVMERIKGAIIGSGWVHRNEESKAKLLSQLAKMVAEMRELQPPDGIVVASVDTHRLSYFHRHLRMGMEFNPGLDPHIQNLITHGDLSGLNILIHGDDIVGIIDWETAGWYPSYWEYTSAHQVNP